MPKSILLIIGASSGIGRQIALKLSKNGHKVFASFNKNKIKGPGGAIGYHHCNVLDETLDLTFLPQELNGLVYCPGTIILRPFVGIKPDDFVLDYRLQVVGAIKILQAVLDKLKASGNALIVFFSTVAVRLGFNYHTQVAASKGALEGLTKSLAAEPAPSVRVNAIAPSLTDTPLSAPLLNTDEKRDANAKRHPLKKIGSVNDMTHMAEFLLTDKSAWINGHVFPVDGGMSAIKN